jgi:hypothetical protein
LHRHDVLSCTCDVGAQGIGNTRDAEGGVSMPSLTSPARGALVRVRSRAYLVEDVDATSFGGPTWLRLACIDDDQPDV